MKVLKFAIVGLAVIGLAFFAFSSPSTETDSIDGASQTDSITIDTVKSDVELGAKFLDVRTEEEFTASRMEGAELFQLIDMQAGSFPEVEKDTKLYLYCRSGNRSAQAKTLLEQQGFTDVVDLGGLDDVMAIGAKLVVSESN